MLICVISILFAVDEIQVACYKILAALYQLGTDLTLDSGKTFIKKEIDRHRPAIGSCLGAFAATFPVAFLEPMMNKNNPWSIHNRIADQSLEAQGQCNGWGIDMASLYYLYSFAIALKEEQLFFLTTDFFSPQKLL